MLEVEGVLANNPIEGVIFYHAQHQKFGQLAAENVFFVERLTPRCDGEGLHLSALNGINGIILLKPSHMATQNARGDLNATNKENRFLKINSPSNGVY